MTDRAKRILQFLALAAVVVVAVRTCFVGDPVDVVTFNIEDFPRSERQVEGAFATIATLEPEVVAVQEIGDTGRFRREAKSRLGESWRTVWPRAELRHTLGLLYDASAYTLETAETHRGTVVCDGCKPTLEARLRPAEADDRPMVVLVVHLKAYDDGLDLRRRQYAALQEIAAEVDTGGDRLVVVGDFNSTLEADRQLLGHLADVADLRWTTRRIGCTGYWKPEERCRSTTLDHLLVEGAAPAAVGRGPCREIGCEPGASCPVFFHDVSDHCPVTVTLPAQ